MAELKPIYNSKLICPICDKNIEVTKVRSKFVKLTKQDPDFCPYYENTNPILYEAWVCNHCGYAAHSSVFSEVSLKERKAVLENISPKWTSRVFIGERNIEDALEAFKMVLYNLQIREASFSEFAKVCLRIAWLHRYREDAENEHRFIKYSCDYYKKAYSGEHLHGGLDTYTCMFIIGELSRRLGDDADALRWFGQIITAASRPGEKHKILPHLLENTREQIHLVKESM